ncbi:DUF1707 domain-containing protein [Nonomuraea sp. NPDC049419]|uniref:DUF1707 SHOCT-like domain-containing protein n=1 Tax=Nonomuraea sp. NPDC049419 TaxID=3155772 RepID=UPI003427987A
MSEMRMRVSDEDREQTAQRLQRAFSEGRLTHPELDERLERALTAKTYADLLALIDDLPADEPRVGDVVELSQANGAVKRSGDWAVPRRLRAGSKYGAVDLDFSDAVIPHQVVEIELDLQYGNARITVPEGAVANIDGFESTWGATRTDDVPSRPRPGALSFVITGRAKYGGLTVRYPRKRWFTH